LETGGFLDIPPNKSKQNKRNSSKDGSSEKFLKVTHPRKTVGLEDDVSLERVNFQVPF